MKKEKEKKEEKEILYIYIISIFTLSEIVNLIEFLKEKVIIGELVDIPGDSYENGKHFLPLRKVEVANHTCIGEFI